MADQTITASFSAEVEEVADGGFYYRLEGEGWTGPFDNKEIAAEAAQEALLENIKMTITKGIGL